MGQLVVDLLFIVSYNTGKGKEEVSIMERQKLINQIIEKCWRKVNSLPNSKYTQVKDEYEINIFNPNLIRNTKTGNQLEWKVRPDMLDRAVTLTKHNEKNSTYNEAAMKRAVAALSSEARDIANSCGLYY